MPEEVPAQGEHGSRARAWVALVVACLFVGALGAQRARRSRVAASLAPGEPARRTADGGLQKELVLRETPAAAARVRIWRDVVVSCKGQVFKGSRALVGCSRQGCGEIFSGCGFGDGTCVWDSGVSHVSKSPYCVANGQCVKHAPGPSEKSPLDCRERPEECWQNDPSIAAGPLKSVVVLTQPQWGAYYHFLVDGLTRLHWIRVQHPELLSDNVTMFHTGMVNKMGQVWAQFMGIDTASGERNRLLDGWWQAKIAYFPPENACANDRVGSRVEAIRGAQDQFARMLDSGMPKLKPKLKLKQATLLVIKRDARKSVMRSVTNHDEVMKMAREFLKDWAVEEFSDYPKVPPPGETCGMFHGADIVMGPHGAGMSNLLCARRGTVLIEFQQETHSWDFQLLSMKLGMPYIGIRTHIDHRGPGPVEIGSVKDALISALQLVNSRDHGRSEGPKGEEELVARTPPPASVPATAGAPTAVTASAPPVPPPQAAAAASPWKPAQATAGAPTAVTASAPPVPPPQAAAAASPWKPAQAPPQEPQEMESVVTLGGCPPLAEGRSQTEESAEVHIWTDVIVSCKGQAFSSDGTPLIGCAEGECGVEWKGCDFRSGTCVWDSAVSHVSKKPYCVAGGICVERAPGPSEAMSRHCREATQKDACLGEPGVVAGPLDIVVVLTQPQWGTYYHFVIDALSRIVWLRERHPAVLRNNLTFFHTGMVSETAQSWARLVGIRTSAGAGNRLLDGWWRARTVYMPPATASCGEGARPAVAQCFRRAVADGLSLRSPARGSASAVGGFAARRAVFVRQARDVEPALDNQEELLARVRAVLGDAWSLATFNVDLEKLDALAACRLFSSADLVIGRHAGLANLVCARQSTAVVELQDMRNSREYRRLIEHLGMPYWGIPSQPTLPSQKEQFGVIGDLGAWVDEAALRPVLLQAVQQLPPTEAPAAIHPDVKTDVDGLAGLLVLVGSKYIQEIAVALVFAFAFCICLQAAKSTPARVLKGFAATKEPVADLVGFTAEGSKPTDTTAYLTVDANSDVDSDDATGRLVSHDKV